MTIPAIQTRANLTIAELRRIAAESRARLAVLDQGVYAPKCYRVLSTDHLLQHADNTAKVVVRVGDEIVSSAVTSYAGVTMVKFQRDGQTAWLWLSELEEVQS